MNSSHFVITYPVFLILVSIVLLFTCQSDSIKFEVQQSENDNAEKLHKDGWALYKENRFSKSVPLYYQSIEIRESILARSTNFEDTVLRDKILEGIIRSYNNLGLSYYELGAFEETEQALETCLYKLSEYEKKWGLQRTLRKAWAAHQFGRLNQQSKGIEEALSKFELALNYSLIAKDTALVADIINDIGALFVDWREPDSVIFYVDKALKLYTEINFDFGKAMANQNLGYAYVLKKNYTQAQVHLGSAFNFFNKERNAFKQIIHIAKVFHNKAIAYHLDGNFPMAQSSIDSAIEINTFQNNFPESYLTLAQNYSNKADIYLAQGDLSNAKNYYEKSILQFGQQDKDPDISHFSVPESEKIIGDKIGFIEALAGRGKTFAAMGDFTKAMDSYKTAIQYFDTFRKDFRDKQSKIQISSLTKQIFEAAISMSYKTQPEQAFQFAETSKSYALLEAVRHYKAFDILGIKSDQLKQENELRREISNLAIRELNTDSTELKIELNEQRERLQEQLEGLNETLKKNENYQKLMSASVSPSIADIQKNILEKDQALIEYFVGEDSTYIFCITHEQGFKRYAVPVTREMIKERVAKLIASINQTENTGIAKLISQTESADNLPPKEAFKNHAFWMYQNLLAPLVSESNPLPQRLVIIPDDLLGYVPFDALLTSPVQDGADYYDYSFMAKQYAISYCYSISLLKEMQDRRLQPTQDGIFVYTHPGKAFENQRDELAGIFAKEWKKGKRFMQNMDPKQPKKAFRSKAKDYRFVHFSTHGEVNDSEPNLSFLRMPGTTEAERDNLLYLYEIYNIPLNAELLVTGACETGAGRFLNGEGIMSLARGFSYAGAKSIITTLWAVNQDKTEDILNDFYRNLANNMSKDMALFKAKKDYLENNPQHELHPYLWAGIIPIGNMMELGF
ncbi:MAG: hypothetical protein DHS20C18_02400 [Saprospiraceae bacterium]|nr:MAG: hypothetical protein DHS20C18_02400 [Saprospiraceae bacterium]